MKHQYKMLLLPLFTILLLLAADGFLLGSMHAENSFLTEAGREKKPFPSFHTFDIYGRETDSSILLGKTTAICIWTTKDEPSHKLLKELGRLAERLPEDVQLVGLVGDLKAGDQEALALAQSLAHDLPAYFPQFMVNDDFLPLLSHVHTVPTICFTDQQGNMLGQPVLSTDAAFAEQELQRVLALDSPRSRALREIQEALLHHP